MMLLRAKIIQIKTKDFLFDNGNRRVIKSFKTSYTFEANDGEVPELEIFIINKNHIIINQGENIVFLERAN